MLLWRLLLMCLLLATPAGAAPFRIPQGGTGTAITPPQGSVITSDGERYFGDQSGASVVAYGAAGNGIADDTAAFVAAIAAENTVTIPAGTFVVTQLLLKSNLRIIGAGVGATILKLKANSSGIFANTVGVQLSTVEIAHMTVDGNGANQTSGFALVSSNGITNLWIHDLYVKNSVEYCVGLERGHHINVVLDSLIIENCRRDGIDVKNEWNDNAGVIISNITVMNPGITIGSAAEVGSAGIDMRGPVKISNITVRGLAADQDGIRFQRDVTGPEANCQVAFCQGGEESSLTNFHVDGSGSTGAGVHVRDGYVNVSNGNVIGMGRGVYIESAVDGTAPDVLVQNVAATSNITAGFETNSLAQHASFINCTAIASTAGVGFSIGGHSARIMNSDIKSNATHGIAIASSIDNVRIIGNTIFSNVDRGISVATGDTNTVILGNILAGNGTALVNSGTTTRVRNNPGVVTNASGSATIASGDIAVVVTHGLAATPLIQDIAVTQANQPTNDVGPFWVSTITATQFTINVASSPGAATAIFAWQASILN